MPDLYDALTHFSRGVVTSAEGDREDLKNALVRADNAVFTKVANGRALIRKRQGMSTVNRTPLNNSSGAGPAIVAGFPYRYTNGSTRTNYTVVLTATGNAHILVDDGATSTLTATASLSSVLNTGLIGGDAAEMNNRLFVLDRKGGQLCLKGTSEVNWGVTPVTGLALAETGAGDMDGDYDVRVTAYDENIDAESDVSDVVSITGMTTGQLQITVNSVAVGLTNMFFRVYLRDPDLGSGFWRVTSGTSYDSDAMGFPLNSASPTVSTTIDISATDFEDLVLPPPPLNARGVPPTTAKYVAVWQRRLWLADDSNVYWSELDLPDAFNPLSVEPITSPRGGNITGLMPTDDGNGLRIYTESGHHSVTGGADPNSWTIQLDDREHGCVSRGALVSYRMATGAWDAEHGPMFDNASNTALYVGEDSIRDSIAVSEINPTYYDRFLAAGHDGRIIWGVVPTGQTKVQQLFSFNMEMGAWESTNWDPMDLASLFVSYDSTGASHLYAGNYNGQLFRLLEGTNDGVVEGTSSGTFTAGASSINSITDATAAFDTTGAGLRQRRVTLVDADGQVVDSGSRIHVSSNTGTVLTLSGSFSGLTTGATYTYLIGGPNFVIETYWGHLGFPFVDKRFDFLYTEFEADSGVAQISINTRFAWGGRQEFDWAQSESTSELWDIGYWDESSWDGSALLTRRISVIRRGINYRIQVRNPYPDQGFVVYKLAVLARQLSDRYAGNTN